MNKMRLVRDKKWFFQSFPYHQIYMDNDLLKGWVSINYLTDGETRYWDYEKAGRVPVCGKDMVWLTIIPDNKSRCIGAYFLPNRRVSTWYIDVIDSVGIDEDGVVYYIDKYLDIMLTTAGDVVIKDRDELDAAYASGELSKAQYDDALCEGEQIINELASDIEATEQYCIEVLNCAEKMIAEDRFTIFLDIDGVLDIFNPEQATQELIPQAISNLKNLVSRTKADIVIISDWRYGAPQYREKALDYGYSQCIKHWDMLEAALSKENIEIKNVTPWDDKLKNRTAEIKKYLEEHPAIKRYVILDDCFSDDFGSDKNIQKHLVFVDALKGLQHENLEEACKIMNLLR